MARHFSSYRSSRRRRARAIASTGKEFCRVFAGMRLNSTADGAFNPADGYRPRLLTMAERMSLLRAY